MMARIALRILPIAALLLLSSAVASRADAQCRLCDSPTTVREADNGKGQVQLDVQTNLNFDRLILIGAGEGTAVLRPDGSSSSTGMIADVSPRAMVGTVTVHGEPGRTVRVDLPSRIVLHSLSGGEVSFDDVTSDLPSLPKLDSAGNLTFRFGGRLKIIGDAEGDYRGDLPITAEYL
ncbi:MAG TPA: DUF4402 domain-containing protein [Sphingomicrobium sp.]